MNLLNFHNLTEEQLTKRLFRTTVTLVGITVFLFLSFFVFAPKIGWFFSLFSFHRNDKIAVQTKPSPPTFKDLKTYYNTENITLTGNAQSGLAIKLFVNGPEAASSIAGTDNTFTLTNIKLMKGKNMLFAKAINSLNEESEPTNTYNVYYDNDKPKVEDLNLKDGDTIRNLDKRVDITGKITEKAYITINDKIVVQKPDNTFDFLLGVDKEGDVEIKIVVTDLAGNKVEQTVKIKYVKSGV